MSCTLCRGNNIRILFNRRSSIKEFELPKKPDIEALKVLVTQKSWFNYVFKGKGYLKALNRVGCYSRCITR
jgi:hypothetical protein